MKKLKIELEKHLSILIVRFVMENLIQHGSKPTMENVSLINEDDIDCSSLNIPMMYELKLYQQQIKK